MVVAPYFAREDGGERREELAPSFIKQITALILQQSPPQSRRASAIVRVYKQLARQARLATEHAMMHNATARDREKYLGGYRVPRASLTRRQATKVARRRVPQRKAAPRGGHVV